MLAMAGLFLLIELYAISFLTFSLFCVAIGFVTGTQMTLPAVVMVELIGKKLCKVQHAEYSRELFLSVCDLSTTSLVASF